MIDYWTEICRVYREETSLIAPINGRWSKAYLLMRLRRGWP